MKTATIYARVSSTGDRQDTARQVEDLTAYAQRNELEVVKVFTEKLSGLKKRSERPVFDECMKFTKINHVDVLLLSELSRMGRNADDVLKNVLWCKETKQNVYFQKEQLSIFTEEGKEHPFLNIFIAVLSTMAQMEAENIKYRLNSGREKYIRDGGKLGREGYRKSPDEYRRDYPEVFKHLRKKDRLSYDNIAKLCDCSKRTVITIAEILGLTKSQQPADPTNQKTYAKMSNILESKNVFELAARRAAWAAKIAEHPDYDVTMSYDDGDVVRYEGRLRMMYHGRFHDFPDGITDADAMLHYCRMKEAGMTPAIKNSGA